MRRVGIGWTTAVWRLLCLLTVISGAAALLGLLESAPLPLLGLAAAPGLLVMLLYAVAWWADSSRR